ncbi:radical SAM protein [Thermodesulfovibrio sp.]|jgi:7-carboxy-7-deazaguanine synthase|uniref:radical SAM protein n=1 Tax=Thermodesulfovibrio TaxID=28261 RepID=UPI002619C310|nr:radical SAM protein [Thermodesulfovibrio sp.]
MKISEIFISIQGEGSLVGIPMIFVRLSGCNLRCTYCDTTYSYDNGKEFSVDELLRIIKSSQLKYVAITGGEPLLQNEIYDLMDKLIDMKHNVVLETNGSISIERVPRQVKIILDIKTPGSSMESKNCLENLRFLKKADEIKFVITDRRDYEWAKDFLKKYSAKTREILFSPAIGFLQPSKLAEWIIEDRLQVRFNLQIHKFLQIK